MAGMDSLSPYRAIRQLQFFVQSRRPDNDALPAAQKAYDNLLRQVHQAQHVLRDYELSAVEEDTRTQLRLLPKAVKSLEALRAGLLKASEYELVGAVDVAQYTAGLDQMIDRLR